MLDGGGHETASNRDDGRDEASIVATTVVGMEFTKQQSRERPLPKVSLMLPTCSGALTKTLYEWCDKGHKAAFSARSCAFGTSIWSSWLRLDGR